MLLRSGFKKMSLTDNSTQVSSTAVEAHIIPFDHESGINFESWLTLFNNTCTRNNLDENWQKENVSRFLRGSALTTYVNKCLNCNTFTEIALILKEQFIEISNPTFSDFANLKLTDEKRLTEYFQSKLQVGRNLGMAEHLILEGLTEGVSTTLKQLLTISSPKTPTEWIQVVSKLIKAQPQNPAPRIESSPSGNKPSFVQPQMRPRYFSENRYRPPWRNNSPNLNPNVRPFYPARMTVPRQTVHFNSSLPPSPCRVCENRGILNAYHWAQTCAFRRSPQNITPVSEVSRETNSASESSQQ